MSSNNTPTVSISDLVPLVVAALKDQAITDENEELRQQLNNERNERLLVQVTGPKGAPVYYQASLKDGGTCRGDRYGDTVWIVPFGKKKKENVALSLNLVNELEVRLGGNFLFFLKDTRFGGYEDDFNRDLDEPQMGGIHFNNIPSQIFVHGKIGPILWLDYSEALNQRSIPQLALLANDNANQTGNLIITAVVFNMDQLGGSIISLLNQMGISTTYIHDESWVTSIRNTGRPPFSSFFGDVRVGVKDIKSKLVLYLKDPSITFRNPLHPKPQLKLLLEMVDDPQFSYSLRDYCIISTLISVLPMVFSRDNVDDVGETNEESLKTINEILKNQEELVKDIFSVIMKVMTEPWVVKELLEFITHLADGSNFKMLFLQDDEGNCGFSSNNNKNILSGVFFDVVTNTLVHYGADMEVEMKDTSIKVLGKLSLMNDCKVFGTDGALPQIGKLFQQHSGNETHKNILFHIMHDIMSRQAYGPDARPDKTATIITP
mmetsp:Transcript_37377/g.42096  ORF Transcript_37377/g.42096 Transcript_37377/m.42096 type:complete len:490 (+) Transcript_37377:105-1574(+)